MSKNRHSFSTRAPPIRTNVPEVALIEQIRCRPSLYDKNCTAYRKPQIVESEWLEVATELGASVVNCKKRWKSLRDTFIKYYRLEIIYDTQKGSQRRRQKSWIHYDDLSFLKNHVEIYRLADQTKDNDVDTSSENYRELDGSKIVLLDEETDERDIYEIQIRNNEVEVDEENLIYKDDDEENQLIEQASGEIDEEVYLLDSTSPKQELRNEAETLTTFEISNPEKSSGDIENSGSNRNITDPDERYLMSCLPTFKRFNAQQKGYVRMAIEKLFYEVEFENVSEPRNKRLRTN